jgi:hypothetical protein
MTPYILESLVTQTKRSTALLRLPPELLSHILVYLDDGYDLMRVRQVSEGEQRIRLLMLSSVLDMQSTESSCRWLRGAAIHH